MGRGHALGELMAQAAANIAAAWQTLSEEVALWAEAEKAVALWWRDDDAVAPSNELTWLEQLTRQYEIPLSLAVIPQSTDPELGQILASHPASTCVLVHGLDHHNYAVEGEKKSEFAPSRPLNEMKETLSQALHLFAGHKLADKCLPVLVPPWNRIPDDLVLRLPELGYQGLSTYKARNLTNAPPDLVINNCHVDPINWKAQKSFLGEVETLALITGHLSARRTNEADFDEITGILTHHLVQDAKTWAFLEKFAAWTMEQPTVRWLDAHEVFKLS
jgi:hypothetical protein